MLTIAPIPPIPAEVSLVAFSHLRWDFVRQRPQHLLSRFARQRPVWVWEEPIGCDHPLPYLEHHRFPDDAVTALRPRVPHWWEGAERTRGLARLFDEFRDTVLRAPAIHWYYTPAMRAFSAHAPVSAVVYDCMDELSAFAHADPALVAQEAALLEAADVVFTGGRSLYQAKRTRHPNVHEFPSAVDVAHFGRARGAAPEPDAAPVLGYYGVIDERIDLDLVDRMAGARPDWQFEMIGPVAKIDPAKLPQRDNIHWAGPRPYDTLPAALAGWTVALIPFARNEATRYISPTKTPEYLAGGKPVVSTPIADVVAGYGDVAGVWIADDAPGFVAAASAAMTLAASDATWLEPVDALLADASWDRTHARMDALVADAVARRRTTPAAPRDTPAIAPDRYDVLVVGAGFAGAVMAERLAADARKRVLVVDRRPHVGGNAYDEADEAGILIHRYGPHIFHTNSDEVFAYLSRFTKWRPYEHRVLARVRDLLVPMPINRTTLEQLYGVKLLNDEAAARFLAERAEPRAVIATSEDVVVNAIGQELYETFFRGYTRKQWGLDPSQLDRAVTARVPTRTTTDDRYFTDKHQAMPLHGYTKMFDAILDHPNITVMTGTDYRTVRDALPGVETIFTGPIDEFFDFRFGKLPYRSLKFVHETHAVAQYQPAAVVNYPSEEIPFTRITEYKQLTGQVHERTSISYEFPSALGDPYYPIPRPENQALFRRYEELADATPGVHFVGRLASYRYYNMDQVVGQALATYRRMTAATVKASA